MHCKNSATSKRKIIIFFLIIGNLFSQVFFIATNSNFKDLLPEGQSQVNFENNEIDLINWEFSGASNWKIDSTISFNKLP